MNSIHFYKHSLFGTQDINRPTLRGAGRVRMITRSASDRSHCGGTINWPQRIHNEFGAPASIIIASFIRDGYSRKLTAGALGISRTALMNYCRTFGIQWPDAKTYRAECRAAFTGERRGYSNNPHGYNQWTGRKDTHDFNGKEIQGRARETR